MNVNEAETYELYVFKFFGDDGVRGYNFELCKLKKVFFVQGRNDLVAARNNLFNKFSKLV